MNPNNIFFCGKKGHSANTCDFLTMSVFLQRHLKNGIATKDTVAVAESLWIDRWKDNGATHTTTPSKVYTMYAANSGRQDGLALLAHNS